MYENSFYPPPISSPRPAENRIYKRFAKRRRRFAKVFAKIFDVFAKFFKVFGPRGRQKNFETIDFGAANVSVKESSKSELSSRFLSRLKFLIKIFEKYVFGSEKSLPPLILPMALGLDIIEKGN